MAKNRQAHAGAASLVVPTERELLERLKSELKDIESIPVLDYRKVMEAEDRLLSRLEAEAKARGSLVGRYLREPYADSYAFYLVVAESDDKRKVKIQSIPIGDAWVIPYWGESALLDREYAERNFGIAEAMQAMCARQKATGRTKGSMKP